MTAYLFSARGSAAFTPLQCPAGPPRWELQALAPIPNLKRAEARAPGTLNTYATAALSVQSSFLWPGGHNRRSSAAAVSTLNAYSTWAREMDGPLGLGNLKLTCIRTNTSFRIG